MNMQTDIADRMLANRKQQERGRDVVEDSSLQARARKSDPKWMKNLGLGDGQESSRGQSTNRSQAGAPREPANKKPANRFSRSKAKK